MVRILYTIMTTVTHGARACKRSTAQWRGRSL